MVILLEEITLVEVVEHLYLVMEVMVITIMVRYLEIALLHMVPELEVHIIVMPIILVDLV